VRFLESIERKGRGWNLTLQVLDGILCHDGELHQTSLAPSPQKTFEDLDREIEQKSKDPRVELRPMTLEGCVVRLADTISYIGRDIEDAIRLRLIRREDIPKECKDILGDTNGKIVYTLVSDLAQNSLHKPFLEFSEPVAQALGKLKEFNQSAIYQNRLIKTQTHKIELMFSLLFEKYLRDLESGDEESDIFSSFLDGMSPRYLEETPPPAIVRDFIAGMTDDYFLAQCQKNLIPEVRQQLF
jgi:dGTPase